MRKKCKRCEVEKNQLDFSIHKGFKDKRNSICKICKCEEHKKLYKKDPTKTKLRNKKAIVLAKQLIHTYLEDKSCIDCGEKNPIVLDFDHVKGTKISSISRMACTGKPLASIAEEIKKCEIRCANCHRIATYNRRINQTG